MKKSPRPLSRKEKKAIGKSEYVKKLHKSLKNSDGLAKALGIFDSDYQMADQTTIENRVYIALDRERAEKFALSLADINCWLSGFVQGGGHYSPGTEYSLRDIKDTLDYAINPQRDKLPL